MLDLLFLPFRIAWSLLGAAFDIFFGLISLIFGILGGALSLAISLAALALIIGLLRWFFQGRKKPDEEDFVSFYHQD